MLLTKLPETAKVIYYTHPFCPVSWAMQESWQRFISTCSPHINFQLCMLEPLSAAESEGRKPGALVTIQAIKAAAMQSHYAADLYLSALRSALFLDMRDITRSDMLIDIARQVNKSHRDHFEFQRFGKDFSSKGSRIALKADFEKARVNSIIHCPTITFTTGGRGVKLTGSRTYAQLLSALSKISENKGRNTAASDR